MVTKLSYCSFRLSLSVVVNTESLSVGGGGWGGARLSRICIFLVHLKHVYFLKIFFLMWTIIEHVAILLLFYILVF